MTTRKQALDSVKRDLAQRITNLIGRKAAVCDDDRRVVKYFTNIRYEDHGQSVNEPIELEIYIKEVRG
jgi:hypothetical protein